MGMSRRIVSGCLVLSVLTSPFLHGCGDGPPPGRTVPLTKESNVGSQTNSRHALTTPPRAIATH
jgi:hypothetical protein